VPGVFDFLVWTVPPCNFVAGYHFLQEHVSCCTIQPS